MCVVCVHAGRLHRPPPRPINRLTPGPNTQPHDSHNRPPATTTMASPSSAANNGHDPEAAEAAIQLFCDLLRFRTVSFEGPSSGAYRACAQWLVEVLGGRLGLETQVCGLVDWVWGGVVSFVIIVWGERGGVSILIRCRESGGGAVAGGGGVAQQQSIIDQPTSQPHNQHTNF